MNYSSFRLTYITVILFVACFTTWAEKPLNTNEKPNSTNQTPFVDANAQQANFGWVLTERKPVSGITPAPVEGGEVRVDFGDDAIEMLLAKPYGNSGGGRDFKNPQRMHARFSWSVPEVIMPGGQLVIVVKQEVFSNKTGNWANAFGVGIMIQNNWSLKGKLNDGTVVEPWVFGIGWGRPDWAQKNATVTYERTWLWNEGRAGDKRMVSVSIQGVGTQRFEYTYEWKPIINEEANNNPAQPVTSNNPATISEASVEILVGDWDFVANGYDGILEIRSVGSSLQGRVNYKKNNKWEPLENLNFNPSTRQFLFYRPNGKQQHEGVLDGSTMKGTFSNNWKWSATKTSQTSTEQNTADSPTTTKTEKKPTTAKVPDSKNEPKNTTVNTPQTTALKFNLDKQSNIPPSKPMPFLDITTISKTEWDGAVSAAMEGMRLVYGPMTAEEDKKFVKSWAPLRQTPFKEAVDYLNKFNPLLGEFLTYRTSITQTGILLEEAVKNAGTAAEYDDPQLSFGYLDLAKKYQNLLISRQKRLQLITNEFISLGNVPDGAQIMAEQQRQYKNEKDYLIGMKDDRFETVGFWAGYEIRNPGYVDALPSPIYCYIFKKHIDGVYKYGLIVFETGNNFGSRSEEMPVKFFVNNGSYNDQVVINRLGGTTDFFFKKFDFPNIPKFDETSGSGLQKVRDRDDKREYVALGSADPNSHYNRCLNTMNMANYFFKTALRFTDEGKWIHLYQGSKHEEVYSEFRDEMASGSNNELNQNKKTNNLPKTNQNTESINDKSNSGENYLHLIDDKNPEDRREIDTEAIEFHKTNLAIIQKNMERDQQDLTKEKDPNRQKDFQMRILGAQANLQAENDRIATIQTGIIVHNRSPWDDYAKSNFIQNIAEDQQKMENISKGIRKAYEMADRLPDNEARAMRAIIGEKYNGTIMANLDEKAAQNIIDEAYTIGKKYYQGKIDVANATNKEAVAEAEWANSCLQTAEIVKKTADNSMMVLSLFGGKYVNNTYQGITGYIEGGPKEAFLRVSGSYNTVTGVAVDGFRGFEDAVNQGGDFIDGALGAGWEAAKGLITEKAMSFGVGKISSSFNRPNGDLPNIDGPTKPGKGVESNNTTVFKKNSTRSVEPDFNRPLSSQEIEIHRQQVADGRNKVNSYKKTYEKLETARKAGAPPSEIKQILVELDDRSAKIHSSPQAKIMMKTLQKQPNNLDMIKRYSNSMDRVHQKVEKRFQAEMEKNGWSPEELEAIRNRPDPADLQRAKEAQAKGETVLPESLLGSKTVNMDYDAGRKVKLDVNGKPIPPTKNGKSVPIEAWQAEAQTAWEKSYKDQTGQIASHSWENITHGKMADAYADLSVLQKNGIKQANKEWAGQTADVSYYKAAHLSSSAEFKRVEKYVEIARGTSKDCRTKMMPLFEQKKPKVGTPSYDAWLKHKNYWEKVNGVLENMGSGKKDPLNADREIREITGGKSVLEVTFDMRNFMESLLKLGNN